MKKRIRVAVFFSIVMVLAGGREISARQESEAKPPAANDVHIGPDGMAMPLERFIMVRKGTDYCAIKFTRFRTGRTADEQYADYISYFQDDKSGDFTKSNVHIKKDELDAPKPKESIFGHPISTGNRNIRCGPIKLRWSGRGSVYFYSLGQKKGDYGNELAPTSWTDIKEVNVFDPRMKWYKYDCLRKRVDIPIDKL